MEKTNKKSRDENHIYSFGQANPKRVRNSRKQQNRHILQLDKEPMIDLPGFDQLADFIDLNLNDQENQILQCFDM